MITVQTKIEIYQKILDYYSKEPSIVHPGICNLIVEFANPNSKKVLYPQPAEKESYLQLNFPEFFEKVPKKTNNLIDLREGKYCVFFWWKADDYASRIAYVKKILNKLKKHK